MSEIVAAMGDIRLHKEGNYYYLECANHGIPIMLDEDEMSDLYEVLQAWSQTEGPGAE